MFTNCLHISPYQHHRDPLYCWEVDPGNGSTCSDLRVVFDSRKAKVPISPEAGMAVDQAKLLPHTGGDTQFLIHRVRPVATNNPRKLGVAIKGVDKKPAGWYYPKMNYTKSGPGVWPFE